jgi:BirA family biotin operon repressor/biotin-[acetyl-CoA-carboxylase] ligase
MSGRASKDKLAEDLLLILRRRADHRFATAGLVARLKAEPGAIDQAVSRVAGWGYRLTKSRGGQIRFIAAPDCLTDTEVRYGLRTKLIGRNVFAYGTVQSTNDLAAQLAEAGVYEGTIVTAEEQTRGRGRLGRNWYSPYGAGVYVSVVLRPDFAAEKAPGTSIMAALALAETLSDICPGAVQIKWPNDILLDGKKVAGILTELSADGGRINHLIVGVGVNVNQKAGDFPPELKGTATSLRRVLKKQVDRVPLLQNFLARLEKEYGRYRKDQLSRARGRIRGFSSLLGSEVKLMRGKDMVEGTAVDIDASGCLIIARDGKKVRVASGEVTVVKAT